MALRFPTVDGGLQPVQPNVFHHVMDNVHAAAWQIVQSPDDLEILLVEPQQLDPQALTVNMQFALTAQGVRPPDVHVRTVAAIPRTLLGKAPLIKQVNS
jgi:phenylacetate-CoA ligase